MDLCSDFISQLTSYEADNHAVKSVLYDLFKVWAQYTVRVRFNDLEY